jgi:hypothetical protein
MEDHRTVGNSHQKRISLLQRTRTGRQISSHFEYLKKWSSGLDKLGSQSEETLLYICEQSLSHGASKLTVRCHWRSLCTVWPSHWQWPSEQIGSSWQYTCPFYTSHAGPLHHPGLSAPYSPDLAPCDFWFFPKLKFPLKRRRFVNAMVTLYTSSVNGISLPTD